MLLGFLFLSISIFGGVAKGYSGKKTSSVLITANDTVLVNCVRMFLCALISLGLVIVENNFLKVFNVSSTTLSLSLLCSACLCVFLITWFACVRTGTFMLVSVFTNSGMLIPLVLGSFLFNDKVSLRQWFGVLLLLVSVYIMIGYNQKAKGKMRLHQLLLLVLLCFSSGLYEFFVGKAFNYSNLPDSKSVYSLYTYIFSTIMLVIVFAIIELRKARTIEEKMQLMKFKPVFGYVIVMAICLFLNSYFKTMAGEYLSSAQLYSANVGASLFLSTIMSAVFFGEKPTKQAIFGISLDFVALLVINL